MQKKELSQQSDFFLADESDLCDNVGDNYDVVIADKTLRRVNENFQRRVFIETFRLFRDFQGRTFCMGKKR